MDVLTKTKSGELERIGVLDLDDMLIETEDFLLIALFDEARNPGFAVPVEPEDPRGGFELVRLTPSDPASITMFQNFLQAHGYEVEDMEAA